MSRGLPGVGDIVDEENEQENDNPCDIAIKKGFILHLVPWIKRSSRNGYSRRDGNSTQHHAATPEVKHLRREQRRVQLNMESP